MLKMTCASLLWAILFVASSALSAQTGYVRFLKANDTVPEWEPIAYYYVETFNPTSDTFRCVAAVVIDSTTATPVLDLNAGNRGIVVPPNTTQIDTLSFEVINDHLHDPFERIVFRLVNLTNPLFIIPVEWTYVYILDDDPFSISFIGAGRSVVEQDTTFLLRVALNGLVDGATSVRVSLDLSNATKGKDFDFKDTTIIIAPLSWDTFYIPVIIYDDTIIEPNEQINFTLSNATNGAIIDIAAFTLTIVDNDLPLSVLENDFGFRLKLYPNPTTDFFNIAGVESEVEWKLFNAIGEIVWQQKISSYPTRINCTELPTGLYFLKGESGSESITRRLMKQ